MSASDALGKQFIPHPYVAEDADIAGGHQWEETRRGIYTKAITGTELAQRARRQYGSGMPVHGRN